MKIFADTGDIGEIRELAGMRIIDGVTTNPSLVAKAGVSEDELPEYYRRICDIVNGDVSAEVTGTSYEDMVEEGRRLACISPHIVVKIPCTEDGLRAIHKLTGEGIRVNCTLVFSVSQAILSAKAGAYYVSPFIGRLDDISEDGLNLIADIMEVFSKYSFGTKVLAASVRHPYHFVRCAKMGVHAITAPPSVLRQLVKHPLTDAGLKKFLEDYQKVKRDVVADRAK